MQVSASLCRVLYLSRLRGTSIRSAPLSLPSVSQSSVPHSSSRLPSRLLGTVNNPQIIRAACSHPFSLPHLRSLSIQSNVEIPSAVQKTSSRELLLSPPALVITREYEWANIIIGFEQANKYTIRAAPGGGVVGFLAEVSDSNHAQALFYVEPTFHLLLY